MRHQPLFRQGLALYYHVIAKYYRVGLDGIAEQAFADIDPPPLMVEIPVNTAYEAACQQAALDYFELRDEFDRMGAVGPSPFGGETGSAFDAADAALLEDGKFVSRPRVLRPGAPDTDRLATRPGDRLGLLPDGTVISFDRIALAARCAGKGPRRALTEIRVIVTNASLTPLPSTKEHPLKLGYKWYLGGEPVWEEFPRIVIPAEVVDRSEICFGTLTPPRPGLYEIEVDLMYDGLFWFQCPSRAIMAIT